MAARVPKVNQRKRIGCRLLCLSLVWSRTRRFLRLYLERVLSDADAGQAGLDYRVSTLEVETIHPKQRCATRGRQVNKYADRDRFACTNWDKDNPLPREHVEKFAKDAVKYLDELAWVERYAWFGPMRDVGTVGRWARMIDDDGQLTPLGKAYRDE